MLALAHAGLKKENFCGGGGLLWAKVPLPHISPSKTFFFGQYGAKADWVAQRQVKQGGDRAEKTRGTAPTEKSRGRAAEIFSKKIQV
ncbi:hypothetical protein [Desulfovibrio legallii]|jgi:hypothetical protein|uniref:hypothetical protein n=1 Tax=Desulfovibrio legallii TaxID=571438 RepID=UPI0011785E8C|nr:hypothetical protein [Desulfovibrio legallii]